MAFVKKNQHTQVETSRATAPQIIACLDIGEAVIQAALLQIDDNRLRVIGFYRQPVSIDLKLNLLKPDTTNLANICFKALKTAKGDLTMDLDLLAITIGGNFVREITHKTQLKRSKPKEPLTQAEWEQMVARNQTEALQIVMDELCFEKNNLAVELELLNSSLVGFVIDGQPATNPIGQPANFVGIQLYNVFIAKEWSLACKEIANKMNLNLVSLVYKPFALASGILGAGHNSVEEMILIHMENSHTYVTLIKNGIVLRSRSFSIGAANFDKALSRNLTLTAVTIDNFKNNQGDFSFDDLEEDQRVQAKKILQHTTSVWLQALVLVLRDFNVSVLPSRIALSGIVANYKIISVALQKSSLIKVLNFQDKLQVSNLTLSDIYNLRSSKHLTNQSDILTVASLGSLTYDFLQRSST